MKKWSHVSYDGVIMMTERTYIVIKALGVAWISVEAINLALHHRPGLATLCAIMAVYFTISTVVIVRKGRAK